jgi:hypothetical protein
MLSGPKVSLLSLGFYLDIDPTETPGLKKRDLATHLKAKSLAVADLKQWGDARKLPGKILYACFSGKRSVRWRLYK